MLVSCYSEKHMFCTFVISALHLGYLKNHQRGHLNSSATSGPMKLPSQPNARRDSLREDCSVCSRLLCRSSSDGQQSSQQLACSSQLDWFQVRAECIDFEVTQPMKKMKTIFIQYHSFIWKRSFLDTWQHHRVMTLHTQLIAIEMNPKLFLLSQIIHIHISELFAFKENCDFPV